MLLGQHYNVVFNLTRLTKTNNVSKTTSACECLCLLACVRGCVDFICKLYAHTQTLVQIDNKYVHQVNTTESAVAC